LQGEMLKDEPSEKRVTELVQQIGQLRTQQHLTRLKQRLAVRNLLTPEQRDRMLGLRGLRHRWGHRAGPCPGTGEGWGGHDCSRHCSKGHHGHGGRR
jgi:Spy/CpxP family protein refolding chaperone